MNIARILVADVGDILEQEFIEKFGSQWSQIYRAFCLRLQEHLPDQKNMVLCAMSLLTNEDRAVVRLALLWLSRARMTEPEAHMLTEEIRCMTCAQAQHLAQRAAEKKFLRARGFL